VTRDDADEDVRERVVSFVENNPGASVPAILGRLMLAPEHRPLVEAIVDEDGSDPTGDRDRDAVDPDRRAARSGSEPGPTRSSREERETSDDPESENGDSSDTPNESGAEGGSGDANPGCDAGESGRRSGVIGAARERREVDDDDRDRGHENPIDVDGVTDEERARMLLDYLDAFRAEFGTTPMLMPLDAEGKAPWITDRCSLDSAEADAALVEGHEAARQIHHEGARGFAIYAGRGDHGTEGVAFVDHDDTDAFPSPTGDPTLEVLSGSGRGTHETYRNDADDPVANARVGDGDGEVRAENWYVVVPGSVHPSGGVYHVVEERKIAPLADDDLDNTMRPSTARNRERTAPVRDADGEGDRPDDDTVADRLDAAFANDHDGERIRQVYDGRYRAAGFDDRSAAEFWLANRLDSWVGRGREATVERVMDSGNLQKWSERTDRSYRDSVLSGVGTQDWYYDPENGDEFSGYDPEPVSTLPLAQLDALDPDERRRAARKRGHEWPTTDELREQIRDRVVEAVENEQDVVLGVPTAAGKSHTAATLPWLDRPDVTDGAPVVHLSETREARDERVRDTRGADRTAAKLRGRRDACPVARGEHDPLTDEERERGAEPPEQVITIDGRPASEWLDEQCDRKGVAFSAAHQHLDDHNDQGAHLPCCPPVDASPDAGRQVCPAVAQWNGVPRDDEGDPCADVIHATHPFAHVPGLTRGSVVVFDEQPDFTADLGQDRIRRMVVALLDELDAPVTTFEAFVSLARMGYGGGRSDAGRERDALVSRLFEHEPGREWYLTDSDAHTLAPAIARALWYALGDGGENDEGGADANGRRRGRVRHEPPRLDANAHDDEGWNCEWVTVVVDEQNTVRRVRAAPDLSGAKCVIGLDAHPTPSLWQLNTKPGITVDALLDADERRLWRRYERGLCVVQVGDADRPAGKDGRYFDERGTEVLVEQLRERYGEGFRTAIAPKATESDVRRIMRDAGIDVETNSTMHPGEEKSRNDFDGEPIGAVLGSIDAGDDYVLDGLAELDLDARPETNTCERCGGEGCSDDRNCRDGDQRARGRGFVGPDAETAGALVASVRENHVAQGAGRYARDADDPEDTAVVFCRTAALPTGFADYQVSGVERVAGEKQRLVTEVARENPGATARELKALVDDRLPQRESVSKRHVAGTLADLLDRGIVQRSRAAGEFGGDTWDASGATDADAAGEADLVPEAIANSPVWGSSTWGFVIHDEHAPDSRDRSANGWGMLAPEVVDGGDRPPDTLD
jgi:hypothetical protein